MNYSAFNLVIMQGGCGGFFASDAHIGEIGQQQQGSRSSLLAIVLGGAGGGVLSVGGATNPFSSEPSPEPRQVPIQRVNSNPASFKSSRIFFSFYRLYNINYIMSYKGKWLRVTNGKTKRDRFYIDHA
jgi:hypothetical protein